MRRNISLDSRLNARVTVEFLLADMRALWLFALAVVRNVMAVWRTLFVWLGCHDEVFAREDVFVVQGCNGATIGFWCDIDERVDDGFADGTWFVLLPLHLIAWSRSTYAGHGEYLDAWRCVYSTRCDWKRGCR